MSGERPEQEPPSIVGGASVALYTVLDHRHRPTGACSHVVAGEPQAPFAGLAICQSEDGYFLFYCDEDWNTVTDTWHASLAEAKEQAEFEYEGVGDTWARPAG